MYVTAIFRKKVDWGIGNAKKRKIDLKFSTRRENGAKNRQQ